MASISANGYVHTMLDKNQTFEEYALSCARAFGALVTMREDPMDAPIPEELKPDPYYLRAEADATRRLKNLLAMSAPDEKEAYGEKRKSEGLRHLIQQKSARDADVDRCRQMLPAVEKWEPPTVDHQGLKRMMLENLHDALKGENDDYYKSNISKLKGTPALKFYNDALDQARRDIEYYRAQYEKEVQRMAGSTQWVKSLRESLRPEGEQP